MAPDQKPTADQQPTTGTLNRWPYRVAMLLAIIVFPLIWVGGLVTTYEAGMAVPDWPNTYNYNMFAYPVRDWVLGPWDLFVEHGHRLLATIAGIVSIALVLVTLPLDRRPWLQRFAVLILLLVVFQGVLGGARVLLDDRMLAMIHGCVGPAYLASIVAFIACASPWWHRQATRFAAGGGSRPLAMQIPALATCLAALALGQLVVGAHLRHMPADAGPMVYRGLLLMHLTLAGVIVLWVASLAWLSRRPVASRAVPVAAVVLAGLVLLQVGLGFGTWIVKFGFPLGVERWSFAAEYLVHAKNFWKMNIITAHVAIGSAILAVSTLLAVQGWRIKWCQARMAVSPQKSPSAAASPQVT